MMKRYKREILSTARRRRAKQQGRAAAVKAYMDEDTMAEDDMINKVGRTRLNIVAFELYVSVIVLLDHFFQVLTGEPEDDIEDVRKELSQVLYTADRRLAADCTALASHEQRQIATTKAYEQVIIIIVNICSFHYYFYVRISIIIVVHMQALRIPDTPAEPNLSLLPPSLATVKAYSKVNTFVCATNHCLVGGLT